MCSAYYSKRYIGGWLAVCLYLVLESIQIVMAGDKPLAQGAQVLAPALSAWREYREKSRFFQGSQHYQGELKGPQITFCLRYDMVWKIREGCQLWEVVYEAIRNGKPQRRYRKIFAYNPRYVFILEKPYEQQSLKWFTAYYGTDHQFFQERYTGGEEEPGVNTLLIMLHPHMSLVDLVTHPRFRLLRYQSAADSKEATVEFTFDNHGLEEKYPFCGGKLILDPQHLWCLRSYEVQLRTPSYQGQSSFRLLELEETATGFPWPRRARRDSYFDNTHKKEEWQVEGTIPSPLPAEEEFTLSAFGFPEPPLGGGGRPWYVWLAWGGILFLLLGLVCRWLLRRRAAGAG
jgi:hypothetical protein